MMTETGFDIKQHFKTAKHFSSWLGYAPNRKITGDKVISSRTPKVKKPLTAAIRQASNAAGNSKTRLGDFFRRIAYRKGREIAIVATARKISVIIFKMLETGAEYSYSYDQDENEKLKNTQIKKMIRTIKRFDIKEEELIFI